MLTNKLFINNNNNFICTTLICNNIKNYNIILIIIFIRQ